MLNGKKHTSWRDHGPGSLRPGNGMAGPEPIRASPQFGQFPGSGGTPVWGIQDQRMTCSTKTWQNTWGSVALLGAFASLSGFLLWRMLVRMEKKLDQLHDATFRCQAGLAERLWDGQSSARRKKTSGSGECPLPQL